MTTTELIRLLKRIEFGASGRPREISITTDDSFYPSPDISIFATGDGIAGAELCLSVTGEHRLNENEESQDDPDFQHLVRIYEKSGRKFELAIRRYVVQKDITSNVLNRFLNYIDFEEAD